MEKNDKKTIALLAPLSSYTGYGLYGRSVSLMLIHLYGLSNQYEVMLFDIAKYLIYNKIDLEKTRYKSLVPYIVLDLSIIENGLIDIFIVVSIPKAFLQKGLVNIGITALSEADILHPSLIDYCNTMDLVCVMSKFNVDSLKKSVFTSPLRDLHILSGISIVPYALKPVLILEGYRTDVSDFIDNIPQKNLFLNVGQWLPGSIGSDRKDVGSLIGIFLKGFANNKDVGLLLKTLRGNSTVISLYLIRDLIRKISLMLGIKIEHNNINIISGNIDLKQMVLMYKHEKVKAFTTFTHGLSCGIPLMLFAYYTGKPIIAPFHTGIKDYLKPLFLLILVDGRTPVPGLLLKTYFGEYATKDSHWHTVDYLYALLKMLELFKGYKMFTEKSFPQKKHIESNYNIEVVSKYLKKVILKYTEPEE